MNIKRVSEAIEDQDQDQDQQEHQDQPQEPARKRRMPALDAFGVNLTQMAEEGKLEPVIGRESEVMQLCWILLRKKKNNPVLIGEAGVGKTAIVEHLAKLIADKKAPKVLHNKTIISVDMASIISGTSNQGDVAKRVKAIMIDLEKNEDVILFMDEIHLMTDQDSGSTNMDVANILKPGLARGTVKMIGATTLDEFRNSIEKDKALDRRFQKIMVNETTLSQTIDILNSIKDKYEDYHMVEYTDGAIKACVSLANKHITDRFFPDKAIDLMDEVGAKAHLEEFVVPANIEEIEDKLLKIRSDKALCIKNQQYEQCAALRIEERGLVDELEKAREEWESAEKLDRTKIEAKHVAKVLSLKTGIPATQFSSEDNDKYLNVKKNLAVDVIGQDEAITKLAKSIKRNAAGLKDPKKPIGVFLFTGQTGTGKTQTAKSLAKHIFGSEDNLVRIDMSEYSERHTKSRLIGSPPGYVGYGEGGQLTEKIRRKPYSVLLLDEIEKAHPEVLTTFLQVFDDGHLTDAQGRKINFKNTIIIMTSNIGTQAISDQRVSVGFGSKEQKQEDIKSTIKREVHKHLPAEFINRIDAVIVFNSLSKENLHKIIEIEIEDLSKRLKEIGIDLEVTDSAKDFLIEKGYDSKMGARPLKRAIANYIEEPLSDSILRKNIEDKVVIDYKDGDILINGDIPVNESTNLKTFKQFIPK